MANFTFSTFEKKYLLYAGIFLVLWFNFIIPTFSTNEAGPYTHYLLFNIGLYILFVIILRSITSNTKLQIEGGTAAILFSAALDIIQPPYMVSQAGQLVNTVPLADASVDYIVGYFGQNVWHLQGILLYNYTYVMIPILLLIGAGALGVDVFKKIS